MKIAIIGSGISGLSAAYYLDSEHEITIYEAEEYIGGHTHTVPVYEGSNTIWIDTGFIVCNPKNYPNFLKFIDELSVSLQKSSMSFSVSSLVNGLEYNGTSFNSLFAQRKNFFNIDFLRMLKDIVAFNKEAKNLITADNYSLSLQQLINNLKLSNYFKNYYLLPMISAIWSNDQSAALLMPAIFVCRFLNNHGMLNINDRPQWYSICGGSHTYVKSIVSKIKAKILTNTPAINIMRTQSGVVIQTVNGSEIFDKVIIATHSNQALRLLQDPSKAESSVLSAMNYQTNEVVLHTDINLLPRNRQAWASWNYKILSLSQDKLCVTYNMNILQDLNCSQTYCLSLNQTAQIDPTKILYKFVYSHPIYNNEMINAQSKYSSISGVNNTYYCGAYWGNGFHEDGLNSGLKVVEQIKEETRCAAQFTTAE